MSHPLKKYLSKRMTYGEFARLVGTSGQYISHIVNGYRQPSMRMALVIEAATGGEVSREALRPDVWAGRLQVGSQAIKA